MAGDKPDGDIHRQAEITGDGLGAVSFETAFQRRRTARSQEIDQLGHVNNAVYLTWAQDIAVAHWETAAPHLTDRYYFIVLRHEVDYRDPILPGETAAVRTWLGRRRGPRFERHVDIRKAGAPRPAAAVLTDWCMIDAMTGKPKRVGDDVMSAFGLSGYGPNAPTVR